MQQYWGACQGAKAWLLHGEAMRIAYAIGPQNDATDADQHLPPSTAVMQEAQALGLHLPSNVESGTCTNNRVLTTYEEIRRRTYCSCCLLNQHLGLNRAHLGSLYRVGSAMRMPIDDQSFLVLDPVCEPHAQPAVPHSRDLFVGVEGDDLHIPGTSSRKVSYRVDSAISIYLRALSLLGRIRDRASNGGQR